MPGHRRSIRLKGYDYSSAGAYFVTICTWNRECLFGNITLGEMQLNQTGDVAQKCWKEIPIHFPHVIPDTVMVMPNHIHGILVFNDVSENCEFVTDSNVGAKNFSPLQAGRPQGTSKTIGSVIRGFKIGVTKWMHNNTHAKHVWQRNYYEHVIRNDEELNQIREYIITNPGRWERDRENPDVVGYMGIQT